jgi:hypothetical protein
VKPTAADTQRWPLMTHSGHPRRDYETKSPGRCEGFDLIVATSEPGPNQILKLPS